MEAAAITPREQMLRDILTTAVEGGMNYWANDTAEDGSLQVHRVVYAPEHLGGVTQIVFDRAAILDVSGATALAAKLPEETIDGRVCVTVDTRALMRGVRKIAAGTILYGGKPMEEYPGNPSKHLKALARSIIFYRSDADDVDYDAGTADTLVQAALFGDVIYG